MLGKNLNNLCKTIKELGTMDNCVPLDGKLKLVSKDHVCMLLVETKDGSPVFGRAAEKMVDISNILKMKVDPSLDYTVDVANGCYILDGKTKDYRFDLIEPEDSGVKVPELNTPTVDNFDIDAFKDFMKSVKSYADYIEIRNDENGHLRAVATDSEAEFRAMVGSMVTGTDVSAKYPVDSLAGMVSMMVKDTTLSFDTDYPAMFEWADGWYSYRFIIAPKIDCS